jgi:hypothetical protein
MNQTTHYAKGEKPTNPKDLIGSNKAPLHLWPMSATTLGALALLDGALKYGRGNWRHIGVKASIYVDALFRHTTKWFEGEDNDTDSGLPHLAHALACLAILVDAKASGQLNDDRNTRGGTIQVLNEAEAFVNMLRERARARPTEPHHYTIADIPEPLTRFVTEHGLLTKDEMVQKATLHDFVSRQAQQRQGIEFDGTRNVPSRS